MDPPAHELDQLQPPVLLLDGRPIRRGGVSFLATPELAARYRRGFPRSLGGAPLLLPTDHTEVRRSLNLWFDSSRIDPVVAGEFDDSALMFWFGRTGAGIFPAPTVVEAELRRETGLQLVGRVRDVRERFYAITLEESPRHPGVIAVCAARTPPAVPSTVQTRATRAPRAHLARRSAAPSSPRRA